jgi:hypothetical protein
MKYLIIIAILPFQPIGWVWAFIMLGVGVGYKHATRWLLKKLKDDT